MKRTAFSFLPFLSLVVFSCGQVPAAPVPEPNPSGTVAPSLSPATPLPPTSPTSVPTSSPSVPPWPAEAQPLVDLARADLESRTGADDIAVVRVEAVVWPNGCLGCPSKGEACTDVMIPGYRIVLHADGQEYEYRTDRERYVRLCLPGASSGDWGAATPQVQGAIADLMGRLALPASAIRVVSVVQRTWRDSSLGCPRPGYAYLMVITPGYQIILEAQGRQYDYRASEAGHIVLCE